MPIIPIDQLDAAPTQGGIIPIDQMESNPPEPNVESMQTEGVLGYVAKHPFKAVLQGLPQTITGETAQGMAEKNIPFTPMDATAREEYKKGWGQYPTPTDEKFSQGNIGDKAKMLGGAAVDMATAPINAIVPGVVKVAGEIGKAAKPMLDTIGKANLENRIFGLYNEAVGAKLKNVGDATKVQPQRINAMKAISDNADNLQLPSGERIPQNRLDLVHSLRQTKQSIWDKVTELSGGATDEGAKIDMAPIIKKAVDDTVKGIGIDALKADPGLLRSIQQEAMNVSKIGTTTPSRAQAYMASLNKELSPMFNKGQAVDYSVLDFKRNLVNHLNDVTEASIESTLSKSGYGALRDQYAALKSSEKEVLSGANKYLKQVGGQGGGVAHPLVNLWSVEEAMQAGGHALAGNMPAAGASLLRSGAIKTASKLVDFMKNPDRKISKMFELLDKYDGGIKPGSKAVPVQGELMPEGGWNQKVPVNNQIALPNKQPIGLPEPLNVNGRQGVNPVEPYAGTPRLPETTTINQGGPSAPKALPDRSIPQRPSMRSGVDRPYENIGLPAPKTPGGPSIGTGNTIIQGMEKQPFNKGVTSPPKYGTEKAWELYHKDKFAQENNFIHPAKDAKLQSEAFSREMNPDNPKFVAERDYAKQMREYQKAQLAKEYYEDQLKQQIAQRKFLSKSAHPSEFVKSKKSGEMQDLKLDWMKGTQDSARWDGLAREFDNVFPETLDPNSYPADALREHAQTLSAENQKALRRLIAEQNKIKPPKKLK